MENNNNEQVAAEVKADTAAGADATVTMDAKDAKEVKAEPTARERLDVLLNKQKSGPLSVSEQLQARRLYKQVRNQLQQSGYFSKLMEQYNGNRKRHLDKYFRQVTVMRNQIGRKNFNMLKDLFTTKVEEQKNDAGEVIREASTSVNWPGLMKEARNVIVMERQARIDAGKRKKTTGRGSDRAAHKSHLAFLMKRNAEEAIKTSQKSE